MRNRFALLVLFLIMHTVDKAIAQATVNSQFTITISGINLVRIYPANTTITMTLLTNNAGEAMLAQTNNSTRLQLTSIAPANQKRRIDASISSGDLPGGTLLKVYAESCTNLNGGDFGTVLGTVTLSKAIAYPIINNIASGYTGDLAGNGFRLNYSFEPDFANIKKLYRTSVKTIIVNYTMVAY